MMRHLTEEERELMKKLDSPEITPEEEAEIIQRLNEIDDEEEMFN